MIGNNNNIVKSTTLLLLLSIVQRQCHQGVAAFLPAAPHQHEKATSWLRHQAAFCPAKLSRRSTTATARNGFLHPVTARTSARGRYYLSVHRDDNNNDDQEQYDNYDEDDADIIDLSGKDWRAFRAKLVMNEPRTAEVVDDDEEERPIPAGAMLFDQSAQVEEEDVHCDVESGECDNDGIGALFGLKNSSPGSAAPPTKQSTSKLLDQMTPLDPSQWAYDSGKVIEKGAVILGGVEQEYGFGLRQQYFHKAAILVLDHDESTFTKGIILNRPTDLYLDDDINPGVKWRVWFGGDVQGYHTENPDIVCLHSIKSKAVMEASVPVMNDIQWTTFDNAKRLVRAGCAEPEDFWVFSGYAGWGPQQLSNELDKKSWYVVATDPQTLLQEMKLNSAAGCDPRDAGLETWSLLMHMIGRGETADDSDCVVEFDDLMLKEWALKNLLGNSGHPGEQRPVFPLPMTVDQEEADLAAKAESMNRLLNLPNHVDARAASHARDAIPGSLVRAAPKDRSPFLLDDQEFHKSVVLLLSEDENLSVGAILNRPATKALDIQVSQKDGSGSRQTNLPIRFGGQYTVQDGEEALLWVHCNPNLRAAQVGVPIGADNPEGVWQCNSEDVTAAVGQGLAAPEDFLVVTGLTVWNKNEFGDGGIQDEIRKGKFEVIPSTQTPCVWDVLKRQETLHSHNLLQSLDLATEAWNAAAPNHQSALYGRSGGGMAAPLGNSQQDRVFKTDEKVSDLSDKALRSWVATFLLGAPTLGA